MTKPPVYDAMDAALEMGKPGVERMVAAVAQTPLNREPPTGAWRPITKDEAETLKAGGEYVDWIEGAGYVVHDKRALEEFQAACQRNVAQTPPDQFMDDYKRDTTNAMAARILELEALHNEAVANAARWEQRFNDIAQTSPDHIEITKAGVIDWKMEAERANRLYADASYRIEALEAALREIDNMAPATCEVTLAHQMADCARAALTREQDK